MSLEALKTQTPDLEIAHGPASQFAIEAVAAQNSLRHLITSREFDADCQAQGVDPGTDMDTLRYWDVAAASAGRIIDHQRAGVGDSQALSTFELVALTPAYLMRQQESNTLPKGSPQRAPLTPPLSYFNSLVRYMGQTYPGIAASDMQVAMLNTANFAIEDQSTLASAVTTIKNTVRGAQHELGFATILSQTGRQFRESTIDEDVHGVDFIVDEDTAHPLKIDVKASLSEIESGGSQTAYSVRRNGVAVMYSLIRDSEMHDSFQLDPGLAANKAQALNAFIEAAKQQPKH